MKDRGARARSVALPVEDFEALLETLDVLEDSAAMKAVRAVKAGTAKYRDLDLSDENFGLWASFDLALRVANAKQKTSERYSPRPPKSTFG